MRHGVMKTAGFATHLKNILYGTPFYCTSLLRSRLYLYGKRSKDINHGVEKACKLYAARASRAKVCARCWLERDQCGTDYSICGRAEARGQAAYSGVQAAVSVSRWQVGTQARLCLAGVAPRGRC